MGRAVCLMVALWLALAGAASADPGHEGIQGKLPSLFGGPFTLTDHNGRLVTDQSFAGRHMLVYFGYTYCPDICPTDLTNIAAALDALGLLVDEVQPLFITVDPARDDPAAMRDYVAAIHPLILGLTGSEAAIAEAAKAYRVHRRTFRLEGADADDYLVDHSSITYLMDRHGHFVTMLPHGTPPERIAEVLRKYLRKDAGR